MEGDEIVNHLVDDDVFEFGLVQIIASADFEREVGIGFSAGFVVAGDIVELTEEGFDIAQLNIDFGEATAEHQVVVFIKLLVNETSCCFHTAKIQNYVDSRKFEPGSRSATSCYQCYQCYQIFTVACVVRDFFVTLWIITVFQLPFFMDYSKLRYETRQIHAGLDTQNPTCSRGVAIYPTAAYTFESCDHAAKLFELSEGGNIYTRLQNPTTSAYEERIAALYGAVGALAVSSGMSAILITITSLASKGDNIVASPLLYGGTYNQFRHTLERLGIEVRIAESLNASDFESLIDENTKGVFAESMGNPTCGVPDLEQLAEVAHRAGVPFIVDNTFGAAGYLCNPFDWGADIVVDSATKWINGHGTAMGGIIVDKGSFDWGNGRFAGIAGPSEGYHGLNFYEAFGNAAFIVKCRVDGLRDLGSCPSPFDSYLMMIGLETLTLRVKHQVESTRRLAEYLQNHPKVQKVAYVGFEDHPSHQNASKYYRYGASAVLNAELKGTLESTVRFVESLKLVKHMTMIGDSVTVVTHPASTTHKQLSEADLESAGVTPTLLRISAGLENVEDIIDDFEQAFAQI